MTCVIYVRFSPRKNAESCESCEVQEAYCRKFAQQRGWKVRAVFADRAVSGSVDINARELHSAIFGLHRGETLLAYRRDRLARDLIIGLEIERAVESRGATVAVVDGDVYGTDPGAVMMKQMLMIVAEYERKIIAARTSAAMRQYQREGRRMSSACPFGWQPDPADPRRMVPNEAQQLVVADIVRMRDQEGLSYKAIADRLNAGGSAPQTGRAWSSMQSWRVYMRARK